MAVWLENILSVLMMAESVIGTFANVFVALVNGIDWVKRRKLSSADRILVALAVSRLGLLWVVFVNWYKCMFNIDVDRGQRTLAFHVVWAVTHHFSTWLATSLSVFYLLKIANFSSRIFLYLKRKEKSIILAVLLAMMVLLFFNIAIATIFETTQVNEYAGNETSKIKLKDAVNLSNLTSFTVLNVTPFLISLVCVLLLSHSLCRHLRRMRLHGRGCHDPSTHVHLKALQTVVSFLLLFAVYSVSLILSSWSFYSLKHERITLLCQAAGILYPSGHSCVLIWGNKKLKGAFLSVLRLARCGRSEPTPSGPQMGGTAGRDC